MQSHLIHNRRMMALHSLDQVTSYLLATACSSGRPEIVRTVVIQLHLAMQQHSGSCLGPSWFLHWKSWSETSAIQYCKIEPSWRFPGDVDQLPPVGPGTVLSAAIESKAIPVVDLREIFRQARESNIVKAAHSVQRGAFPALQEIPLTSLQANLSHLH